MRFVQHFACGARPHRSKPAETSGRVEAQELGSFIAADPKRQ